MFRHKSILLISLILLFLTATCVSAADENMTDVLTFEEDLNIESLDDVDEGNFYPIYSENNFMICDVSKFEPIPVCPSQIVPDNCAENDYGISVVSAEPTPMDIQIVVDEDLFPTYSEDDYMVCRVPDFEPIPIDPSHIIPIKGTLADLDKTIQCRDDNSVIQLTRNYTYDEVDDFELKDGIVITKNLTIDGQGYAIDTGNLTTIFKIDGGNLNLINIIFPNADIRYCYHNDVLVSVINYNAFSDEMGGFDIPYDYMVCKVPDFEPIPAEIALDNDTSDDSNTTGVISSKTTDDIKKATPKITAKNTIFKAKKAKKYTITLKNGQKAIKKANVYLKINGKTYKAITNSNGKATFKITKLTKKGNFNAKITFNGNKYYNKTSKMVAIKIK